jgi:hypothetical protein
MYDDQRTAAYREGVHYFCDAAEARKHGGGFMFCPCVECRNEKDHTSSRVIQSHLLWSVSCLAIMFRPSTEKEGL